MQMFEEGGLKEEGGMVDEVSGNDVPIGSTREEVRDDIPAQLSEGEFVFPADVVRFIGLEKLMEMRQEAKAGLKRMEEMGQMGNADEATLPDDMPFSMEDLDIEEQENEEEGEVTDSNFNQGGIVTMAEGGTIPTTENTDLKKDEVSKSFQMPIPQQRTTVQQQPLNIRQEKVPMRGMVTNIPKTEDFLKRKTTEVTKPYSFLDVAPTDLGSRYTGKFKSKTEAVQKNINDVKNEIDAVLSDGNDSESPNGGVQSGGLDYAAVDRFSLDDNLRDVFNDFSKAQLSMFGVVTSNPFGLAISGIGTQLGPMTGGKTAQGPIYSAEMGKIQATAFHQTALEMQNKYGLQNVNNINNWTKEAQNDLAKQGRVRMDFAKDIYNASIGQPYSAFSFNEKDKKGFLDTAKNFVSSVLNMEKNTTSMPTPEIAAKQKGMANLMSTIKTLASKSKVTKQNQDMINTIKDAIQLDDEAAFGGYDVNNPSSVDLDEFGFNNDAKSDVAANGGSKGIGYNPNGTSYSINNNGTYTHSNGTTTNVTDSKGNPINAPDAKNEAEVASDLDSISQDPDVAAQAEAEKGFDVEETFGSGTSTNNNNNNSNDSSDSSDSSDSGGSHICTATYNTGYIEKDHFRTLKKYGVMLRKTDPYMMKAYDVFGPKVASLVHTNKYVTSIAKFLTEYYKNVMLKKPLSIKQKMFKVLSVGLLRPLWRLIGRFM